MVSRIIQMDVKVAIDNEFMRCGCSYGKELIEVLKKPGPILRNFSGCTISKVHV